MSLNNIVFVLGQGGLGRPLAGQDYISGFLAFTANLPSGFSANNRVRQFFSIGDAESAGILDNYADATAATGGITVTAIGADGDTLNLKVTEPGGVVVDLGTYTKTATETTVTLIAAAVKAIINANTITHGYTADNLAGVLTITAPKRLGVFLNSGSPLVATIVGTMTATTQAFSGGVASQQAVWHYHIKRYFDLQPKGQLYVGLYAVPGTYNYAEVTLMQTFANGTIRQIGVFKNVAPAANGGDLTALDIVCKANQTAHKPLVGLIATDIKAVSDLTLLYDASQLQANTATPVISQDGGALGATLFLTTGKSITDLGALLGCVSLAAVSESVAWPQKFNISDGVENDVIAFANGQLFSSTSTTEGLLTLLQNYRYVFTRKFIGFAGTYFNEESTAIAVTSDYAYISNNRVIQKAMRGIYAGLVPALNSKITLNADGTLKDTTVAYFENLAEAPLIDMIRDGDLSAQDVVISTTQNVLSTGLLIITASLVPTGTARNIQVNIGFNVSIN